MRYFHGCYSIGDDTLGGVNRRRKGAGNTLVGLRPIRAARPDGAPIYVTLDNPATFSRLAHGLPDPLQRLIRSLAALGPGEPSRSQH
ncbi:hypothetical protein AQJ46_13315 [Streptomyces canus]|uniref:Uncharacterized protein n=1 Tax=Streptomyces canus TaxID=58343 RepID=A0A101SF03_9ACTN|nr:hypothetical protein AQJ46_13315 [Streptomyces canus]